MELKDVMGAAEKVQKITADTNIIEAVQAHPEIMQVFADYGLGCIGCMASSFESIGEGAGAHGIDVPALIEDLNACIAEYEGEQAENKRFRGALPGTPTEPQKGCCLFPLGAGPQHPFLMRLFSLCFSGTCPCSRRRIPCRRSVPA